MEGVPAGRPLVLAAVPARWGSTRFPGKPLASIAGRPMIAWVVEAAAAARTVDRVIVVTDRDEIGRAVEAAGATAVVLDRPAASGTDRIAQLLEADPAAAAAGRIVNVQGDEPLIEPAAIDAAAAALDDDPAADVATLVRAVRPEEDPAAPGLVKAAVADDGRALYFSRAPVPHGRADTIHVGVYAFRRAAFDRFVATPPSRLERAERLEQLRALEIGLRIRCVRFDTASVAVDVPADVARVEGILAGRLGRGQ